MPITGPASVYLRFAPGRQSRYCYGHRVETLTLLGVQDTSSHVYSILVPFEVSFVRCVEELPYVAQHAEILVQYVNLQDE